MVVPASVDEVDSIRDSESLEEAVVDVPASLDEPEEEDPVEEVVVVET